MAVWLMDPQTPSPQVWLLCDFASMAESIARHRHAMVDLLIDQEPEVVEFADGSGAIVFKLDHGGKILELVRSLFETEFDQEVIVIAGAALCLPPQDEIPLMELFHPSEKFSLNGDTLVWTM